jgi:hypothetical protein
MNYSQHSAATNLAILQDVRIRANAELEKLLNRKGYTFGTIGSNFYEYAAERDWETTPEWMSRPPHLCVYESGTWDGRAIPGHPDFVEGTDLVTYLNSLPDHSATQC